MRPYIPTYRRANMQRTYKRLPLNWKERVRFVADEEDAPTLRRNYPEAEVVIHPPEITTIAKKRAWIIQQAKERKIVMLDDDLSFDYRIAEGDWHLKVAPPEIVGDFLFQLSDLLEKYAHAGLGPRQGNNRRTIMHEENCRMMYVLGYQPTILRENCELGRIENREDFDYTLQLLRKGFPNMVLHSIAVGQCFNAPGGHSLQRTIEKANEDAEKLASLHPGLVRVAEKEYLQSISRKEVVVQWKKAFGYDTRA